MSSHFYHLKKLCRKRGVPLYPYKIDVRDFKNKEDLNPILRQALNIDNATELNDTAYILINEDGMKLP